MSKPKVITKCVADHYAAPGEKIIEFSSKNGGGLISFLIVDDKLYVSLYRLDNKVIVKHK